MSIPYPPDLPCPSRIEGYSVAASAGLVRTPMEAGNTRQRRTQRVLPTQIAMVFVMSQKVLADWLAWVNAHAWDDWVLMNLPGQVASRAGTGTAPTPVRFSSDLAMELLTAHRLWYWRVRVTADWLPTSDNLGPALHWIDAGSPGAPAPVWIDGGHAPAPSTDGTVDAHDAPFWPVGA